ncbi:MAG: FAD-binding oxidoreductase [Chloroflexi bacterium]|nr:MAG: FAD-binding oxidoreductase [Chloroflexota bacterium]
MAAWWSWGERPARVQAEASRILTDLERTWGPLPSNVDVRVALPRSQPEVVQQLREAVGAVSVHDEAEARMRHAIGQSYPELLDARRGTLRHAPLAVVMPTLGEHITATLKAVRPLGLAVLPYGGGTSVTGGVAGPDDPYIVLSLRGMRALRRVDRASLVATVDAGMNGTELEAALAKEGVTLGHYPQSFERSTVGGWVATRSVGQFSTGVGSIAELVAGLRAISPTGDIVLPAQPAASEGIDLEGAEVIRALLQEGVAPELVRLSDDVESAMLGVPSGALLLIGAEGTANDVASMAERVSAVIGTRASPLDAPLAARWYETRFDAPFLRDALIERDVIADSLETAALWSDLMELYVKTRGAIARALDPGGRTIVLCHVSHAYATGASLYFTFLAPGGDDALARWTAAKRAALDAIVANGGVVSHHHGVGRDHREWLAKRYGNATRIVDAIAAAFDPTRMLAANRAGPVRTMPAAAR